MPEELAARLAQLENNYYGDKEAARQKQFFDTYGSRFSNNRGLGLAILNELDARGIDTSAADEAVGQILDQLRVECQQILDLTKQVNQTAIENAQKVEQVANVVSDAIANNPNADPAGSMPPVVEPAEMPPEMTDADEPNFEGLDGGEAAPAEGAEPPAEEPSAEEPPAEEPPAPPAEEQAPTDVTSDRRLKRINHMKDHWGKTHTQKKSEKKEKVADKPKEGYKPSKGILSACGGGSC